MNDFFWRFFQWMHYRMIPNKPNSCDLMDVKPLSDQLHPLMPMTHGAIVKELSLWNFYFNSFMNHFCQMAQIKIIISAHFVQSTEFIHGASDAIDMQADQHGCCLMRAIQQFGYKRVGRKHRMLHGFLIKSN